MSWADEILEASMQQKRLGAHGLPPCGRIAHPDCTYRRDVCHAADIIEESKKSGTYRPLDMVYVCGLVARMHGVLTAPVELDVRDELKLRREVRECQCTEDA